MGEDKLNYPPRIKKICRLSMARADRMLDIGCGDGHYVLLFGDIFDIRELYGVDVSMRAVSKARANGIRASHVNIDKQPLPYMDGRFDVVFAGEIIEHLLNPDLLLNEIYRILKKEGICVITTPNLASWYNRIQLLFGYQPYAIPASHKHRGAGAFWPGARDSMVSGGCYSPSYNIAGGYVYHIRFYTSKGITALVRCHGFEAVRTLGASYDEAVLTMPGILSRIIRVLDTVISNTRSSLASRSIIVGVKP